MDLGSVAESVRLVREKAFADLKGLSFKDVHVSVPKEASPSRFKPSWGLTFLTQMMHMDSHLRLLH